MEQCKQNTLSRKDDKAPDTDILWERIKCQEHTATNNLSTDSMERKSQVAPSTPFSRTPEHLCRVLTYIIYRTLQRDTCSQYTGHIWKVGPRARLPFVFLKS